MAAKTKRVIVAGKLSLLDVSGMSPSMRKDIAEWLIRQAQNVVIDGDKYTDKWFRASFRFRVRPTKKKGRK